RQMLGQMNRPDVDQITGLSPAIAVDQKNLSRSPRSTVGTITEIYDFLRLLYARIGVLHCPICGRAIVQQSPSQMVDELLSLPDGTRVMLLAPVVEGRRGSHAKVLDDARRAGYVRVRVDGTVLDLDEEITLDKNHEHTIEIVVDRVVIRHVDPPVAPSQHPDRVRLSDSVETALKASNGVIVVQPVEGAPLRLAEHVACPEHGALAISTLEPRLFSFNSPHGACPTCDGLGMIEDFDPDLMLDRERSLADGALLPLAYLDADQRSFWQAIIASLADAAGFDLTMPVRDVPDWAIMLVLDGDDSEARITNKKLLKQLADFHGLRGFMRERWQRGDDAEHEQLNQFRSNISCSTCHGARLRPEALAVTINDQNIAAITALDLAAAHAWANELAHTALRSNRERAIAAPIMREIGNRLRFLLDVGLHYVTLDRAADTLSGGEAQRIRLATQIGSGLSGVLYVLDEPSAGLHPRDNDRLLQTLLHLRDLGNSVLVVEHDEATIRAAQYLIDMGPSAGEHGGMILAAGSFADVINNPNSITGQFMRGERSIAMPRQTRPVNGDAIMVRGATAHNLKNIDVRFPLNTLTGVTGVSGSGKSTLVNDILYAHLANTLNRARLHVGEHERIEGIHHVNSVIAVDQLPLGKSGRSNAATYTGIFDALRQLFAGVPEAKARGYTASRFSFNVKGGRCETCRGEGVVQISMQFLPDVYIPCEECGGLRYNRETLDIRYRGYSIADVLGLTVEAALTVFERLPAIARKLETLVDVGLGYLHLGQPAAMLSGGEAQRIKLATELARRGAGHTLYILDEPTTGLHWVDIERLLAVLQRLVDAGNTVIVIEHQLDVIKATDWVIDLGPDGGHTGGYIVAVGTPQELTQHPHSWTGRFLAEHLVRRTHRAD
nr:excinuclease ABC subunit UvrA [Herpetosiphon sp.]